jgi:Carboxypeptidase regulatory-like domain
MKTDKFGILLIIIIVLLIFAMAMATRAQDAQLSENPPLTGGQFTISKTVIAGGGAELQNQSRLVQSTGGQAIAGGSSTGGTYSLKSGFWTPDDFSPTAATTTVGGRVITAQGSGIRNIHVTIFFPSGETRSTRTGSFGYYRFDDVEVGAVYVFTVSSKRFVFSQASQVITINDERDDINFIAAEN